MRRQSRQRVYSTNGLVSWDSLCSSTWSASMTPSRTMSFVVNTACQPQATGPTASHRSIRGSCTSLQTGTFRFLHARLSFTFVYAEPCNVAFMQASTLSTSSHLAVPEAGESLKLGRVGVSIFACCRQVLPDSAACVLKTFEKTGSAQPTISWTHCV